MLEVKQQVEEEIAKQSLFRAEVLLKVLRIPDERQQGILLLRYFEGLNWNGIVEKLREEGITYTLGHLYKIHGQALEAYERANQMGG